MGVELEVPSSTDTPTVPMALAIACAVSDSRRRTNAESPWDFQI